MKKINYGNSEFEQSDLDLLNVNGVDCTLDGVPLEVGHIMKGNGVGGQVITFTCRAGHSFIEEPNTLPQGTTDLVSSAFFGSQRMAEYGIQDYTYVYMTLNPEKTIATCVTRMIVPDGCLFRCNTTFAEPSKVKVYEFTESDLTLLESLDIAMVCDSNPVVSGVEVFESSSLTATITNATHRFYELNESKDSSIGFKYGNNNNSIISFTLESDYKVATVTIPELLGSFGSSFSNDFAASSELFSFYCSTDNFNPSVLGDTGIYLVDNDILNSVSNKLFLSGSSEQPFKDVSQFILQVKQYPFKIPNKYVGGNSNVILGESDTGVLSPTILDDVVKIDLGSINVVGREKSFLDYSGVTTILHLPYAQPIILDTNYVVDETISIEYLVSCYTGEVTINITSTKTGNVVESVKFDMGYIVPFINRVDQTVKNEDVNLGGDNGVRTPYIEMVVVDSVLSDGFFTIPVIDEKKLIDNKGYVVVENINLVSKANKTNKDLILNILNSGVVIK